MRRRLVRQVRPAAAPGADPVPEASAREWAKHWFTPQEAEQWLTANGGISAGVAASLRDAGLTPEDATVRIRTSRGFVHKLPLAIRVSSGELSPAEAAAELREMKARRPDSAASSRTSTGSASRVDCGGGHETVGGRS